MMTNIIIDCECYTSYHFPSPPPFPLYQPTLQAPSDIPTSPTTTSPTTTSPTTPAATPTATPTFPLTLQPSQSAFVWKKDADLPFGTFGSKGVYLEEKLYLGGGDCKEMNTERVVYEYDINGVVRKWTALPAAPVVYFALSGVNKMLTLVGGMDIGRKMATNQLTCWNREMQRWVGTTLPPMQTARQDCSTVVHKKWLLVAGGMNYKKPIYNVELLDTGTLQWHMTHTLPKPSVGMTSCVIKNTWYLLGGTNFTEPVKGESGPKEYVFSLSLDENIATNKWISLPDTPLYCCTAVPFGDHLMAVGGTDSLTSRTYSPSMFLYSMTNDKWMYVGNMPSARSQVTCVVLSGGCLAVMGGQERGAKYSRMVEVLHC